jgi:hypothetical protein
MFEHSYYKYSVSLFTKMSQRDKKSLNFVKKIKRGKMTPNYSNGFVCIQKSSGIVT